MNQNGESMIMTSSENSSHEYLQYKCYAEKCFPVTYMYNQNYCITFTKMAAILKKAAILNLKCHQ